MRGLSVSSIAGVSWAGAFDVSAEVGRVAGRGPGCIGAGPLGMSEEPVAALDRESAFGV